jgi:hypothetical protein
MRIFRVISSATARGFALLLFVFGAASFCSANDITYTVDLTVGDATVTGSITTDGTLGVIPGLEFGTYHILGWNLLITDYRVVGYVGGEPVTPCGTGPCTASLIGTDGSLGGSGSGIYTLFNDVLSAAPTELLFNFSDLSGSELKFLGSSFNLSFSSAGPPGYGVVSGISTSFGVPTGREGEGVSLSGTQVIGTAVPVPEGDTSVLYLLLAAAACAGVNFFTSRSRIERRASA